ncbi:hypothetical protein L596_027920 [Steinernema carpocapsae]|uniref:Small integral membrane protein 12 n=1 Tax=Steinernema carpocapsae TaxID=34508 RepID=A0A4U5LWZ2_STECR|nr:hypothetical protein L596_027920 [Steinernema carpocapsae]
MVWFFFFYPRPNPRKKKMLPLIQMMIARTPGFVRIIALPFAAVVGTVGYYLEKHISEPKKIPYLDTSIQEQRQQRLMKEAAHSETLEEEKRRLIPRSSLVLNTGRSASS